MRAKQIGPELCEAVEFYRPAASRRIGEKVNPSGYHGHGDNPSSEIIAGADLRSVLRVIDRVKVGERYSVWGCSGAGCSGMSFRYDNRPSGVFRGNPDGLCEVRTTQEVTCAWDQ